MKKLICIGLSLLFLSSFSACKEKEKSVQKSADNTKVQNLLSVLDNDAPFINAYGESVYIMDYRPLIKDVNSDYYAKDYRLLPQKFAFINLDNDNIEELVVYDDINRCYFILRQENDKIYGYSLYYNMQFKTDGTFRTYHGSYTQRYKTISFKKQDYEEEIFAVYQVYEDGAGGYINESIVDDKSVSYEEIKKFRAEWEKRPDAVWTEYINKYDVEDAPTVSIDKVRKKLQIPDSANVTYEIRTPYYKDSLGAYLTPVSFYEYGCPVAGASVFSDSSEPGCNIMTYTTQYLSEDSAELYYEALEVTTDVYDRETAIVEVMHNSGDMQVNKTQCIPDNPNYLLVTDERFKSIDDLKAFIRTGYTPQYADKQYGDYYFNNPECNYKEYNGCLYTIGTSRSNLFTPFLDTLQIVSQDKETLVIKYGEGQPTTKITEAVTTLYLKKINDIWLLDNQETVYVDSEE